MDTIHIIDANIDNAIIETGLSFEELLDLLRDEYFGEKEIEDVEPALEEILFDDPPCHREGKDIEKDLNKLIDLLEEQARWWADNGHKVEWVGDVRWAYHAHKDVQEEANQKQAEFKRIWNRLSAAQRRAKKSGYDKAMRRLRTVARNAAIEKKRNWDLRVKANKKIDWNLYNFTKATIEALTKNSPLWPMYYSFLEEEMNIWNTGRLVEEVEINRSLEETLPPTPWYEYQGRQRTATTGFFSKKEEMETQIKNRPFAPR